MSHRLSYTLSREELPRDGGETACQLQIHPSDSGGSKKLPLHVVFCVDSSSSMRGGDIEAAKKGVESAAKHLTSDDKFGVVEFDNDASIVTNPVAGNRYGSVQSSVEAIRANGNTNIMDGLEKSRQLLEDMRGGGLLSSGSSEAVEWILLISDGEPNRTNESAFKQPLSGVVSSKAEKHGAAAAELNDQGITVHTSGVGSGYDPDVNEAISDASGGTMVHKETGRGIGDFFSGQIRDARNVVATNPTLTLRPDNGASIGNVIQELPTKIKDPNVETRRNELVVDVPDLNVDDPPQFSFDIEVPSEVNPVAHAELAVDGDTVSTSIEVGFASAGLVRDEVNETVLENRDAVTRYEEQKDSMSAERRAEEKSSGITRE